MGIAYHGSVLPESYYAKEICAVCADEAKILFDHDDGYICGYCKEKAAEDEAYESQFLDPEDQDEIDEVSNG
jgi:ribosomal protein S27AE